MRPEQPLPAGVDAALARAERAGFSLACEPGVGRLLATLAAAVPAGGRILEMGTGVGVGTAWLIHGLGRREDVALVSVDIEPSLVELTRRGAWPSWVELRAGDVLTLLDGLGTFDLIFADAQGGKWQGLDRTVAALRPAGVLVVDDMTPTGSLSDEHRRKIDEVRATLTTDARLVAAELSYASGVIVATRRRD